MDTKLEGETSVLELVDEYTPPSAPKVNKQLYENSPLATATMDAEVGSQGLFGARNPNLAIMHEKPEHRLILLCKFNGMSNREISIRTGYTEPWISQVCRQPWFVAQFTRMCKEAGADAVMKMLEVEGPNSVQTLVALRDTAESETVKATCAVKILEYNIGKAVQKVEHTGAVMHGVIQLDKIDEELAAIEREEAELKSRGHT